MGRRQVVTRNCKSTIITVNVYNIAEKKVEQMELTFPRAVSSTKISARELQRVLGKDYKLLDTVDRRTITEMRAMWLEDFLAQSFPYER